jgi:hypothetical protein
LLVARNAQGEYRQRGTAGNSARKRAAFVWRDIPTVRRRHVAYLCLLVAFSCSLCAVSASAHNIPKRRWLPTYFVSQSAVPTWPLNGNGVFLNGAKCRGVGPSFVGRDPVHARPGSMNQPARLWKHWTCTASDSWVWVYVRGKGYTHRTLGPVKFNAHAVARLGDVSVTNAVWRY